MWSLFDAYNEVACNKSRVAFVPDDLLLPLAERFLFRPEISAAIKGEILFRNRLYRGLLPESINDASKSIVEKLGAQFQDWWEGFFKYELARSPCENPENEPARSIAYFVSQRSRAFGDADGVVPVVRSGVAFPVPFRVLKKDTSAEICFTDETGCGVENWEQNAVGLWHALGGKFRVRLHLPHGISLTGGSFALPVLIGVESLAQGNVSALAILATGAIRNGQVVCVEHCDLKMQLAQKMGVHLWVYPQPDFHLPALETIYSLGLPSGELIPEVRRKVRESMEATGLLKLEPASACKLLRRLQNFNSVGPGAIASVERCIEVLKDVPHMGLQLVDAMVFLASLHNHDGQPHKAESILCELLREEANFEAKGRAIGKWVVSLADMGRLADAETWGRKFIEMLEGEEHRRIPDESLFKMKLEATGSLGGEALFHQALRDGAAPIKEESKKWLELALENARVLKDFGHHEYLKSEARLLLWYVTFEPAGIFAKIDAFDTKAQSDPVTTQFLRRFRYLAAARSLLSEDDRFLSELDWASWSLPESASVFLNWVRASALRCRGALYAMAENAEEAEKDFAEALTLLNAVTSPVFVVLRWSVAAQAVWSLPNPPAAIFRLLRADRSYVLDYLRADRSGEELAHQIELHTFDRGCLNRFLLQYPY